MPTRRLLMRMYLIVLVCPVSIVCYSQQSKTAVEKKDLVINTKMDTLSVNFQNTLIPIHSFSQLDSFIRFNLIEIAKPRVEIRGYPGDTSENFDKVIEVLKKNKISDFTFSMAPAAP
jgi:hypothetical protein